MYALGITQDDTATVTSATGVAESEAVVLAAGTSTSCPYFDTAGVSNGPPKRSTA